MKKTLLQPVCLPAAVVLVGLIGCQQATQPDEAAPPTTCPEGSTLWGSAPPSDLMASAPTAETRGEAWVVYCGTGETELDRHGPYRSWYSNGHVELEGVFSGGMAITYTRNDRWGRPVAHRDTTGAVQRFWWHANNTRAIAGTFLPSGAPDGEWSEWDEDGTLLHTVTFTDGVPDQTAGERSILLLVSSQTATLPQPEALTLPATTSLDVPPVAVTLAITRDEIWVDGELVLALEDGVVADADRRGMLIRPLYDRLQRKAEQAQSLAASLADPAYAFQGELLIMADQDHPWSLLLPVMYTGGQAQFSRVMFIGRAADLQWPPRTGPAWQQGESPLAGVAISRPQPSDAAAPSATLAVEAEALRVLTHLDDAAQPLTIPCKGSCWSEDGLDIAALQQALLPIKEAAPASTRLIMVSAEDAPLSTLIRLIDGVRQSEGRVLFPDVEFAGGSPR